MHEMAPIHKAYLSIYLMYTMQEIKKNKVNAPSDEPKADNGCSVKSCELNVNDNRESPCSISVSVEPESTACKEADNAEGEALVANSVHCVEQRPLKKSKLEVDETQNQGAGNLFLK
jgi:tRNA-dihydrouridine synthase 3